MNRILRLWLAALALAGTIAIWGCSQAASESDGDRTAGEVIGDATTTAAVKIALAFEPGVRAIGINVDTDRGTVTLRGAVDSVAERQLAGKVAEDVSGVDEVVNEIAVEE
jgi:osmotically-inducible protein OsmY